MNTQSSQIIRKIIATFQTMPVADKRATFELLAPVVDSPPETVVKLPRHYQYRFTCCCWACGKEFISARSTSRTCSVACRNRLYKSRKQIKKKHEELMHAMGDLQDMVLQSADPVMQRKARAALEDAREQMLMACAESRV